MKKLQLPVFEFQKDQLGVGERVMNQWPKSRLSARQLRRAGVCDSPGSAEQQLEPGGAAETGLAQCGRVWHSGVWHGCAAQRWETTAFLFLGLSTASSGCRYTDKVGTNVHISVNKSKRDTGGGFFSLIFANSKVELCSVCDRVAAVLKYFCRECGIKIYLYS